MAKMPPIRQTYDQETAKARFDLYRGAHEQLKRAVENGFYIEAVAICESMLSDRLQARYGFLNGDDENSRRERTLSHLITLLIKEDQAEDCQKLQEIYTAIDRWRLLRNKAIHNVVKLNVGDQKQTFGERYSGLEEAASTGKALVSKLNDELKRQKRRNLRHQAEAG